MKKIYALLLGLFVFIAACNRDEKPVVTTGDATNVQAYTVQLLGALVDDYNKDVVEVGFLIGSSRADLVDPYTNAVKHVGTLKGAEISADIMNLIPGQSYFYRAYAQTENGFGYGEIKLFGAKPDSPTLTLVYPEDMSNISVSSISISAKVESFNGSDPQEWGFGCIYGNDKYEITNPGGWIGGDVKEFSGIFEGLNSNTEYRVFAFARNEAGYATTDTVVFKTRTHIEVFLGGFINVNNLNIARYEFTQGMKLELEGNAVESYELGMTPATNVSYSEIMSLIKKLEATTGHTFRLPTKDEWYNIANDGHLYSGSDNIDEVAWYNNNSDNHYHRVGSKAANANGLYDMSGNVWEMTSTEGPSPEQPSHYICGGCYNNGFEDCKVGSTLVYPDGSRGLQVGFRLVKVD